MRFALMFVAVLAVPVVAADPLPVGPGVSDPWQVKSAVKVETTVTLADGRRVVVEETKAAAPVAAVPCEVQGNVPKASVSAPRCSVCKDCDCGPGCVCDAQKATRAAQAAVAYKTQGPSRIDYLLALPAHHRLNDGTIYATTIGESVKAGGRLTAEVIAYAGMTPEEAATIQAMGVSAVPVAAAPTPPVIPQQAAPAYYVAPVRATPVYAQPMPASRPLVGASFGVQGPFGGGVGMQACIGGK